MALLAYNEAIRLNPYFSEAFYNKGNKLGDLKRYDEAHLACNEAILFNPNFSIPFLSKVIYFEILKDMMRHF